MFFIVCMEWMAFWWCFSFELLDIVGVYKDWEDWFFTGPQRSEWFWFFPDDFKVQAVCSLVF